ncbi:MAG: hypothetical protein QF535_09020, partial [Anaerolineales bacterium]|nr:hypothetical protein [Anaerolineales bacterium]
MAARRTNDVPVKDSAGDWNVTLTNPHPNLPYVVVELVLSKPDGTSETTQNQQGIFNLGKLPPGDYSYQYTAVNTINPVNRGPTTNKTFTVPPDTTTTTTTPATAATTDDSAAVIADPLDDEIDGMWAEIDPDAFTASNLRRAINLEIKDEIINILEIPVDTDNINARKISLQSHLQTEIESIDNEKAYILEQKNYYEGHPIHGVLDRLKNPKYPPTQKEIHEQVNLPLTPVGEEKKNLDLVESYNKIRDAKKEL